MRDLLRYTRAKDLMPLEIPFRKPFFAVSSNPSKGRYVPLNPSMELILGKAPSLSRMVGISLKETQVLE